MRSLYQLMVWVALVLGGQSASLVGAACAPPERMLPSLHQHTADDGASVPTCHQRAESHSVVQRPAASCCAVECDCTSGHCGPGVIVLGATEAMSSHASSPQSSQYAFSLRTVPQVPPFRPPIAA